MKAVLLCVLIFASVYANDSHEQALKLIREHLSNVPPVHEAVSDVYSFSHAAMRSVSERAAPSGNCLIALGQALNDGCFPNVTSDFNPATAPVCTNACDTAFTNIYTACDGAFSSAEVSAYTFWRKILCLKDGSTYCYPIFQQLPQENAVLTKANLDAICSPCFAKLLNAIAAFSNTQANPFDEDVLFFFDLVCTKSPSGDYCALELQANNGEPIPQCLSTEFDSFSFTPQCLDGVCEDGCARRLLTKFYLKFGNSEQGAFFKVLRLLLCSKNPDNNKYCLIAWSEVTANGAPADCTATRKLASDLGCCLGSFFQLLLVVGNDTAALISQGAAQCSVIIPPVCVKPPGGSVVGKIVVSIKYSWAAGKGAELKAALLADLAAFFGVPEESVAITDVADFGKRATGTSIGFTATGDDTASSQNLANFLNSQGSNIVFPKTAALYGSENPGQTVEVTSVTAAYSSAATLGVSVLALFAALLVLLF